MLPLKFLLGSLNSLSLETEMLELFDWDETNFAKYSLRVMETLEDEEISFYNGEAFVDHLVGLSDNLLAEDNKDQLKNALTKLVENTFTEVAEQSETPVLEN